jgi:hypothetical protein
MSEETKPGAAPSLTAAQEAAPADSTGLSRRDFVTAVGAGAVAATLAPSAARAASGTYEYRIHPAIGIARVGNLDPDTSYFIGPEIPGRSATNPDGTPIKDYKVDGQIKPQAARFRVFRYLRDASGRVTPDKEITAGADGVASISWRVHVANRKAANYEENGPEGESLPASALRNPSVTARGTLVNDFGPRTITGANAAPQKFTADTATGPTAHVVTGWDGNPVIPYLGQLRTDAAGRLLVFGGKGYSASSINPPQTLTHWSNNNYWFDDIADGPVTATVNFADGSSAEMSAAGKAWVFAAPPDFSPDLRSAISLYDVLYDMAVRWTGALPNNALYDTELKRLKDLSARWDAGLLGSTGFEFGDYTPDYQTEIWPIIVNALNYVYTTGLVNFKHLNFMTDPLGLLGADADKARGVFFGFVRAPQDAGNGNGPGTMPRLYGDNWYVGQMNFHYTFGQNGTGGGGNGGNAGGRHVAKYDRYATLTQTQYGLLRAWNAGNFATTPGVLLPGSGITPHGLDRAALENCIGGPFFPGIECSWQIRNQAIFIEPFRIDHDAVSQVLDLQGNKEGTKLAPGNFSRQMALPWQCDFNDCSKLLNLGWWPSARPDDVFLKATDSLKDRVPWARFDDGTDWGAGTPAYDNMHAHWFKLGFVLDSGDGVTYTEQQRNAHVP